MRRLVAIGLAGAVAVLVASGPSGAEVKLPPSDRSYSLLGASWSFGVFATGVLQEPDFRFPYTSGNASVVVRPIIRGDAAWLDPGFVVRDSQANPSEKPCDPPPTPTPAPWPSQLNPVLGSPRPQTQQECQDQNRKTQDDSLATFRHPFLARCVFPDAPNENVSYPFRIFERHDFKDRGFPQPPKTEQGNDTVLGAVVYGDARCRNDLSVSLRAVNEDLRVGAESAPTLQASLLKSTTNLFFDEDNKAIGVARSQSVVKGFRLMGDTLTIDKLLVQAEARSSGEPGTAKLSSLTRVVGASVSGIPVEIRRDGVVVQSTAFSTEAQRRQAQDTVNGVLAQARIKVSLAGIEEKVLNGGEDVIVEGGGVRIDWELPKDRPAQVDDAVRSAAALICSLGQSTPLSPLTGQTCGFALPRTITDTLTIWLGHVNVVAHAVRSPSLVIAEPEPAAPVPVPFGEVVTVPRPPSTYVLPVPFDQAPAEIRPTTTLAAPPTTPLGTARKARARELVKLPGWAILLLALAAGTVVSASYALTQQRLPIDLTELER